MKNYDYPIDYDWKTSEMVEVIKLYTLVEEAYESGVSSDEFLRQYKKFQKIVGGKSNEKRLDREFMKISGYSIYSVFVEAKKGGKVKVEG